MEENESDKGRTEVLVALLADIGAEVRSRREPESILTAAFVAASGGVAWGVAALTNASTRSCWSHPAIVGALGIVILAATVVIKIVREYRTYQRARMEQGRIAKKLVEGLLEGISLLPEGLANPTARSGHRFSIGIVIVAGIAAALFCLSIYFN